MVWAIRRLFAETCLPVILVGDETPRHLASTKGNTGVHPRLNHRTCTQGHSACR